MNDGPDPTLIVGTVGVRGDARTGNRIYQICGGDREMRRRNSCGLQVWAVRGKSDRADGDLGGAGFPSLRRLQADQRSAGAMQVVQGT